jgi:hypothetical protein
MCFPHYYRDDCITPAEIPGVTKTVVDLAKTIRPRPNYLELMFMARDRKAIMTREHYEELGNIYPGRASIIYDDLMPIAAVSY